jgi:hypothetical protein
VITVGFRVNSVRIRASESHVETSDTFQSISEGAYYQGQNNNTMVAGMSNTASAVTALSSGISAWKVRSIAGPSYATGVVDTITDTSFRLNQSDGGGNSPSVTIYWEAEGEI